VRRAADRQRREKAEVSVSPEEKRLDLSTHSERRFRQVDESVRAGGPDLVKKREKKEIRAKKKKKRNSSLCRAKK